MKLLVYIEASGSSTKLSKSALTTVGAALQAKSVHGYSSLIAFIPAASNSPALAEELASYGLDQVFFAEDAALEPYLALTHEAAVAQVVEKTKADAVLFLATARGKDLAPRVAAQFDCAQASDVIAFLPNRQFKRLMYAGNIIATVELTTPRQVITVRSTAFEPAPKLSSVASVESALLNLATNNSQQFVRFEGLKSERPELTEAERVVSGGRALKSKESFDQVIVPLADALGAAVGASRAAVDSGYAPNDWQVGQTGKVVAPQLYLAVGISGAIQHLAGMKDSKVVVAINKDPEAPIFEVADYGLVADLFTAVPELMNELKKVAQ
ncbi:electron transfer flavoprotein subunit alpha/FixB family protein [bacterium]|nr:electron transfer flavoprotein subunit alpha/FixB family protein [bacterium]